MWNTFLCNASTRERVWYSNYGCLQLAGLQIGEPQPDSAMRSWWLPAREHIPTSTIRIRGSLTHDGMKLGMLLACSQKHSLHDYT
jgi:hypothetical protein